MAQTQPTQPSPDIPPVTVPADPIPADAWFKPRSAKLWIVGDVLRNWRGDYRIKAIHQRSNSKALIFTCWPCKGGRPESFVYLPNEWQDVARGV